MWGLRQVLDGFQPDIVHAHNWLLYSFLPLKPFYRARLVATLHDYSLRCAKKRLMFEGAPCSGPQLAKCLGCAAEHYGPVIGVPTAAVHWLLGRPAHMAVDMFLPISQAVADGNELAGGRWPYQVLPDFLPDYDTEAGMDVDDYLRQLPAGEFLMFAGDLSADKGVEVLLDAYAELGDAPPLVMIGRQSAGKLMPMANVVVLNDWPHAAVMAAWRRCLLAVAPSVWAEPFGLVVLEAMAAGRPVIASRTGGIADIVMDDENGLLVPPGDVACLRDGLLRLLASPELRQRLGAAARRRAQNFSASAVVPRLEQIYRSLVKSQPVGAGHLSHPGDGPAPSEATPDV